MRIKSCLPYALAALMLAACADDATDSGSTDDAVDESDAGSDDTPGVDDSANADDQGDDTTGEGSDDVTDDERPTEDDTDTLDDVSDDTDDASDDADDASDDTDDASDDADDPGDAGNETEPTTSQPADAGSDAGHPAPTLCAKYGGADVVESVVKNQVLGAIADDCRINVFFTSLTSDGLTRVADCLSIQVQELFGCDGVVYAGSEASNGLACRSMADAHLGLGISAGDFNALIEDVVAGLTAAGVEAEDIGAAAPALLGMQDDIVEDTDEATTHMLCSLPDAGVELDAGDLSDASSDTTGADAGWMDAGATP